MGDEDQLGGARAAVGHPEHPVAGRDAHDTGAGLVDDARDVATHGLREVPAHRALAELRVRGADARGVHAGTSFEITIEHRGDVLRVAVRDHSHRPAAVRTIDPTAVRGRGLQLVSAVADSWGCDRHTTGKTVRASLAA